MLFRAARRGMWKNPNEVVELPSEYKRRYASAAAATTLEETTEPDASDKKSRLANVKDAAVKVVKKAVTKKS